MNHRLQHKPGNAVSSRQAFTLLEILVAVSIFSIVLVAIHTVFYSALRLRNKTWQLLDDSHAVNQAVKILRRDLQGVMLPGSVIAPSFKVGAVTTTPTIGMAQNPLIEFYTTTGAIDDRAPWGDIQKITYQLRDPVDRTQLGRDLIRSVFHNLLATSPEISEDQWLLGHVESLEITCFSGNDWRDSWDSTMMDSGLPSAIRLRLQLAAENAAQNRYRQPLELIVPLVPQLSTNQTQQSTGGTP